MRTIKFRGETYDGKIVFGSYLHLKYEDIGAIHKIVSADGEEFNVKHSSITQLIGVDKNGNEIYEGDVLIDELEQEHIAEIYDRPQFLKTLTLKDNHERTS